VKRCKHCGTEKELDEFYKHPKMADGHINVCKPCRDAYVKNWDEKNRARRREIAREWAARNYTPEKAAASWGRWYAKARETGAYQRMIERNIKRGYLLDGQKPRWANDFFIAEIYDLARRRTKSTGVEWHVDHVIPLQGETRDGAKVCGLHVETNLNVILGFSNRSKRNRHWPDMPEELAA